VQITLADWDDKWVMLDDDSDTESLEDKEGADILYSGFEDGDGAGSAACSTVVAAAASGNTAPVFFVFFQRAKCYIGLDQATTDLLHKKIQ
jgi:hypothetical protein